MKMRKNVRLHLCADMQYQEKLVRFIENHDEPRAAATFSLAKQRAAAVTVATQPGARLFHDGQFKGHKTRLPVFLGRGPNEPADEDLQIFYRKLLDTITCPVFQVGQWSLCNHTGWPDNQSFRNLIAWNWVNHDERYLIVVNLSEGAVQARVHLPWDDIREETWRLTDRLSGVSCDRAGKMRCKRLDCMWNWSRGISTSFSAADSPAEVLKACEGIKSDFVDKSLWLDDENLQNACPRPALSRGAAVLCCGRR